MKKTSDILMRRQRETNVHMDDIKEAAERKLASFNKTRENQKLYLEGYRAGLEGKQTLDSFVELVQENDKMVQKKDHRNFKNGYLAGQKELEGQLAKKGTGLSR